MEIAYIVLDDALYSVELFDPKSSRPAIKIRDTLWKETAAILPRGHIVNVLRGKVVFNDDPKDHKNCLTHTLEVALQKLQLNFDLKAADCKKKAAEIVKEYEKYSSLNAKELILKSETYVSPFTGKVS